VVVNETNTKVGDDLWFHMFWESYSSPTQWFQFHSIGKKHDHQGHNNPTIDHRENERVSRVSGKEETRREEEKK